MSNSILRVLPVAVLVAMLAVGAAACGGEDPEQAPTATETTAEESPTASETTPAGPTEVETATEAELVEIVFENGEVQGGRQTIESGVGETLRVMVTADVEDEVHVHGYDVFADVAPGEPAELEVTTDIPGVFEIELEQLGVTLAELEVR